MANTLLTPKQASAQLLQIVRKVAKEESMSESDVAECLSSILFQGPKR